MPTFTQPKTLTRHEIECEICHLQNRLAKNDGMADVLMYQIEQLKKQL
ncbi:MULTISPECIES: hypothetical protein [Mannheimia]|nr:hypothetical protein [Mannheimia varigena]QLD33202.1 hypothetical protein A6B42_05220 [Mannheimia varigena]